jgi:hypothetical protein
MSKIEGSSKLSVRISRLFEVEYRKFKALESWISGFQDCLKLNIENSRLFKVEYRKFKAFQS